MINKSPHQDWRLTLIPFITVRSKDFYIKHIYEDNKDSYLYNDFFLQHTYIMLGAFFYSIFFYKGRCLSQFAHFSTRPIMS